MEKLLPEPSEDAIERERLEQENADLHKRLQHLEQALKAPQLCWLLMLPD